MKKIFRYFLTAENPVRVNLQRDAARKILSRFSRESLKAKRPEHRFLFSYVIKTNVPEIMETLFLCFVRGMRIILLRKNTASAITEEAGVLPVGKQSAGAFNDTKPLTFIGQHRFQPSVRSGKCSQEILLYGRIAVIIVPARCQQTRQQDDKQTTAMFFHTYLPRKLLQFHSDARKKHHLVAAR